MHKAHKTARAIAALFDFSTIRIKNSITKIVLGILRLFNNQNLVSSDTKLPVSQLLPIHGVDRNLLTAGIDDNEVVARALHFGKSNHPEAAY